MGHHKTDWCNICVNRKQYSHIDFPSVFVTYHQRQPASQTLKQQINKNIGNIRNSDHSKIEILDPLMNLKFWNRISKFWYNPAIQLKSKYKNYFFLMFLSSSGSEIHFWKKIMENNLGIAHWFQIGLENSLFHLDK